MIDYSDKFFAGMRNCDIVMLTFFAFLFQIISKVGSPVTNKLCCIEKSISEVS